MFRQAFPGHLFNIKRKVKHIYTLQNNMKIIVTMKKRKKGDFAIPIKFK